MLGFANYILQLLAGPNKLGTFFDGIFALNYLYMLITTKSREYWPYLMFFVVPLLPEIVLEFIVFPILPIYDMPVIRWEQAFTTGVLV